MTRAEMASFLTRAAVIPAPAANHPFTDTMGSVHDDDIGSLWEAGITVGCNPPTSDLYCPSSSVTREQMASFLVRAFGLSSIPVSDPDPFSDDDASVHAVDIAIIAEAGITLGCNPPTNNLYCPTDPVTRAQMASFLIRTLDYGAP